MPGSFDERLQAMRDELDELRDEQEWQRRLRVFAALLPYSGPFSRGWSNTPPARKPYSSRVPPQRPPLTQAEKRIARAAPILAARRDRVEIPEQRPPPALENCPPPSPPRTDVWAELPRQPDGRFGPRNDIDNNRGGRA